MWVSSTRLERMLRRARCAHGIAIVALRAVNYIENLAWRRLKMKVKVVIQEESDGGYSAFMPGFPGCTSCGNTVEETLANIREAFEGVFEVMQDRDVEVVVDSGNPIRKTIEV